MTLQIDGTQRVRVWKVENKGAFSEVQFSSGRKDKRSETYKNSNWSFVRFVYHAHGMIDELISALDKADGKGVAIVLKGANFNNESYEVEGQTRYRKNPQLSVFEFEFYEADTQQPQQKASIPPEDDIPF